MSALARAKRPFVFYTRRYLSELTGLKAATLDELLGGVKKVSGSCIYHHTHRFLQIHQSISPEPPNDFAYWTGNILREFVLAERLASIDIVQFPTIRSLREEIIKIIQRYIGEKPRSRDKFANPGSEFYFLKSVSFIFPKPYVAYDLREFNEVLKKITADSIYFHIFEARLRLRRKTNDFSYWIEDSLRDKDLADRIARLDPYTRTMEDLRAVLIKLIEERIAQRE